MLCLMDSIRDDDPSLQYLLRVLEDAGSLTALILAAWQVARVLAVQLVEDCSSTSALASPPPGLPARRVGRPCGVRALRRARSRVCWE